MKKQEITTTVTNFEMIELNCKMTGEKNSQSTTNEKNGNSQQRASKVCAERIKNAQRRTLGASARKDITIATVTGSTGVKARISALNAQTTTTARQHDAQKTIKESPHSNASLTETGEKTLQSSILKRVANNNQQEKQTAGST